MIEVRMDREIRSWSTALFAIVLGIGLHNAIFPQNLFVEGVIPHVRLALTVWVCPVATAFALLNLYESADLLFWWEQYESAAERFLLFIGGWIVAAAAFLALGVL